MLQLFGLILPPAPEVVDREVATMLAARMHGAARSLRGDVPTQLSAGMREEAQRYLKARSSGALRLSTSASIACDQQAWAIMRLTVDAPPAARKGETLVA